MKNLVDELNRKKALKFQLNNLNEEFIFNTLRKNKEGIFYLSSELSKNDQDENILNYLESKYESYEFKLSKKWIAPQIYFQRNAA
jgi:hypothetical protein